ncbi:hypothetical protein QY96_01471 [Bacillus thermotolerans]|uniref:Uncharacterized protein n=1 Tax=Bacillus thermotolerans TaxID=1221996 RepID=A0A0F5ICP1_BACTR|nr:hypothetical protein QY96_01471 [Bacillus thermotolerans]KKB43281.1 hypothetical protein QY95_01526 [Bacillus thermotolerans]
MPKAAGKEVMNDFLSGCLFLAACGVLKEKSPSSLYILFLAISFAKQV